MIAYTYDYFKKLGYYEHTNTGMQGIRIASTTKVEKSNTMSIYSLTFVNL